MSDGKTPDTDQNGKKIMEKKPCDPFHGEYIRNAIRYLLFERVCEFPDVSKMITIPLVAFVCTLVRPRYARVEIVFHMKLCLTNQLLCSSTIYVRT